MPLKVIKKVSAVSSGGGSNGFVLNRLQIRPTDPIGTLYLLPAKCFVLYAIIKSGTPAVIEVIATDTFSNVIVILPSADYIANNVETYAPTIYLPNASNVAFRGQLDGQTSVDIIYTTTTI